MRERRTRHRETTRGVGGGGTREVAKWPVALDCRSMKLNREKKAVRWPRALASIAVNSPRGAPSRSSNLFSINPLTRHVSSVWPRLSSLHPPLARSLPPFRRSWVSSTRSRREISSKLRKKNHPLLLALLDARSYGTSLLTHLYPFKAAINEPLRT